MGIVSTESDKKSVKGETMADNRRDSPLNPKEGFKRCSEKHVSINN